MQPAIYARYSSDQQRESSIRDQVRNCEEYAAREGWPRPVLYQDAAISGSRIDRPGYQRLLNDAQQGRFDVVLVDDLSRLSRDSLESERAVRLLKFYGVRLIGISDGVDTDQKGYKIQTGLRGIINNIYLDDLAEKTHRGLKGQALEGRSAGGRSYGYDSIETSGGHRKVINTEEAEWVRYIFGRYAAGVNTRDIANELNRKGVLSPRGGTWAHSAIYGDMRRGLGLLNNPLYIGQYIWNRSQWMKDPHTGKRKRLERPQGEWVIQEAPELQIVSQSAWDAVKRRQKRRQIDRSASSGPRGRGKPRYILSGLLKCGCCGGNYILTDYYRYGCAVHKDRGDAVCSNRIKVPRDRVEDRLLSHIREDLLSEEAYQTFLNEVTAAIEAQAPDTSAIQKRLAEAEREAGNIIEAIRQGIITPSTKAALEAAEERKATILSELEEIKNMKPVTMLPRAREIYQRLVSDLNQIDDIARARETIRSIVGEITLHPIEEQGKLAAEIKQGQQMLTLLNSDGSGGRI